MSKMGLRVKNIEVGNRIGEASKFRIYSGKTDSGEQVILKVAKTFEDGDILAEEASGYFDINYCPICGRRVSKETDT